jgi:hypothetical protein
MEMVNVKAMPESISAHNSSSFVEKIGKIKVAKWGKLSKKTLRKILRQNLDASNFSISKSLLICHAGRND